MRRSAFTLIELLVVIGIIAILVAIVLPSVRAIREAGRQVTCASHLRTISQAFINYAVRNDGDMPKTSLGEQSSYDWVFWQPGRDLNQSALAPYLSARDEQLRALFQCPSEPIENQMGFQSGAYPLTYSYNAFRSFYPSIHYMQVKRPAEIAMVYDENENSDDDIFWYLTSRDTLAGRHGSRSRQVVDRGAGNITVWRGAGNVACFDGHVELRINDDCHTSHLNDPSFY